MNDIDFSNPEQPRTPLRIFQYGRTGTGKTYALRTLPKSMLPAFMLDLDQGSRALTGQFDSGQLYGSTFDLVETDKRGKEVPVMYEQAVQCILNIPQNHPTIKTLIVDSFTLLVNSILDFSVHKVQNRRPNDYSASKADYGIVTSLGTKFVNACLQTNFNLIFIGHERETTNEDGNIIKAGPAISPALSNNVLRLFDEIVHSTVKRGEFSWTLKPKGLYDARSRALADDTRDSIPQDYSVYKDSVPV